MNMTKILQRLFVTAFIAVVISTPCFAVEYYLRADYTTLTMPDNTIIPMWGFAVDSGFGALDGQVTVPGPLLTVPEGDPNLVIHLDNNLNVPVSIVINGQITMMMPVRSPDGRVHSFTHETAPGNAAAVDYVWTNFRPGTYAYQSGTHPAVQVQMGLYGGVTKDFAAGQLYEGMNTMYDVQVPLFFSEIDPALHNAVATDNYGPGKAMTSTIDYEPDYFLINGQPFTAGQVAIAAGNPGDTVLLRLFNMGLETRCPLLLGSYMELIAEDGQPYSYPKEEYVAFLTAGKTIDAIVTFPAAGTYPIFDRRLGLTNAQATGGGMLTYLQVDNNVAPVINSMTATPASILDTQTSQFLVDASDTDGPSPLSYNWIVPAGAGSVSDAAIANPIYTPPVVATTQTFTLTVQVSDGLDMVSDTVNITVFHPQAIFSATFDTGTDSFVYSDNTFRGTTGNGYYGYYDVGDLLATGGFSGGALRVRLGGMNNNLVVGISGGWTRTFTLAAPTTVDVSFHYNLYQTANYESNEFSDMMFAIDGMVIGAGANDYLARIFGNGDGGAFLGTGWQLFTTTINLTAGTHTITIGGYNSQKDNNNELTTILVDDVTLIENGDVGGNIVPVINSVIATPASIPNTQTSQLLVDASDTDGPSSLSYNWIVPAGAGSVSDAAIANPIYTPPVVAATQTFTLTVQVSDGLDVISDTVNITVFNPQAIFLATFDTGTDSFVYSDDTFRNTTGNGYYEVGDLLATGGFRGGALRIRLGGMGSNLIVGMSGGWTRTFVLAAPTTVDVSFYYNLYQTANYESNEYSDMMFAIDGMVIGAEANDYLARVFGNGDGGTLLGTGWQLFTTTINLTAGTHTITIGGYNSQKDNNNELTTILVDDVTLIGN